MSDCNSSAATLRIICHSIHRSTVAVNSLLSSACRTAEIILIQKADVRSPRYASTHSDCLHLIPPSNNRTVGRTMAYILKLNPHLHVTPCPDICADPNLQMLEIHTPLIAAFYRLNIYNESEQKSAQYTLPCSFTLPTLPHHCLLKGDTNPHSHCETLISHG